MSNIVRWDPFREMISLRQMMNRVFDESFSRQLGNVEDWSAPSIDMYQTEKELVIKAVLPGMKAEDIQISITGDVLRCAAKRSRSRRSKKPPTTCANAGLEASLARCPCRRRSLPIRRTPNLKTAS